MMEKIQIKQKRWAVDFLSVLLIVAVAALFVMSLTDTAFALGVMPGDRGTLKGEVVAVDHVHNANTVTLLSGRIGQFPNDKLNIFLTKDTKLKVCNMSEPLKDIRVGSNATVKYHERGGVAVADSIAERC